MDLSDKKINILVGSTKHLAKKYFDLFCDDIQKLHNKNIEANLSAYAVQRNICAALIAFSTACITDMDELYMIKKELKDLMDKIWDDLERFEREKTSYP